MTGLQCRFLSSLSHLFGPPALRRPWYLKAYANTHLRTHMLYDHAFVSRASFLESKAKCDPAVPVAPPASSVETAKFDHRHPNRRRPSGCIWTTHGPRKSPGSPIIVSVTSTHPLTLFPVIMGTNPFSSSPVTAIKFCVRPSFLEERDGRSYTAATLIVRHDKPGEFEKVEVAPGFRTG